jgi:hypothetical protein
MLYQKNWDVIKNDFIAVVKCFEKSEFDASRLNCAMLTLIPKEPDGKHLKYRQAYGLVAKLMSLSWRGIDLPCSHQPPMKAAAKSCILNILLNEVLF